MGRQIFTHVCKMNRYEELAKATKFCLKGKQETKNKRVNNISGVLTLSIRHHNTIGSRSGQ